jgi:hypothetical protein
MAKNTSSPTPPPIPALGALADDGSLPPELKAGCPCEVCGAENKNCSYNPSRGIYHCRGCRHESEGPPGFRMLRTKKYPDALDANGFTMWAKEGTERSGDRQKNSHLKCEVQPGKSGGGVKKNLDRVAIDFAKKANDLYSLGCQGASPSHPVSYHHGHLSYTIDVPAEILHLVKVGWEAGDNGWPGAWTIPERDDTGEVIGIAPRYEYTPPRRSGNKGCIPGSVRGLTYPVDDRGLPAIWRFPGPLLIVEGFSDVGSCLSRGVNAVGRPNTAGGTRYLAELLRQDRRPSGAGPVIIVGEND